MIGEHLNRIASSTKSENDVDNSTMADFGKAQVGLKGNHLLLHMVAGLHLPKTNRVFQIICPKAKSMLGMPNTSIQLQQPPRSFNFMQFPKITFQALCWLWSFQAITLPENQVERSSTMVPRT